MKGWERLADSEPNSSAEHAAKHNLLDLCRLATETGHEHIVRFMFREAVLTLAKTWREDNRYSPAELAAQAKLEQLVKLTVSNGHVGIGRWLMNLHHLA